ncbi:terminase large subunit [Pelagibacter phage HTVC011P]|uniref:Terminase, large subunit n=1 Tax=Pelagibacter phage HTVC011P TaxID=1283078 RepID=M1IDV3_9CAUD|nr:terminase large subunit [Pelagibacter phage HTVC011P]AGE60576.1 DNA maturase B [Pelagibacter phage HTVC011P]
MHEKLKDFRNFLYLAWKHLRLPAPSTMQYSIADYIANGDKRIIISAFRGVGKSWITSTYVLWRLLLDPQINILVVSASKNRADDFSTFCLRLLSEMPILLHLKPKGDQRQSKISFDVAPALASHQPSVKSLGITSQLTGSRADLIIADDIETSGNTQTQFMRDKLGEAIKEFEAIVKPEGSRTIFLGTPQTEQSIYNKLQERGYKIRYWTARYPSEKQLKSYGSSLAPIISNTWEHELIGKATDPLRFDEKDLLEREASYGRIGFNMQFQLDTTLSDLDRYPLKLKDLVVLNLNPTTAPEKVVWASSPELQWNDLPNVGLQGDGYFRPMQTQGDWIDYTGCVMSIDPSGKGKDETAYCVTKILNGNIYVVDAGGFNSGYSEHTLAKLVGIAKKHEVKKILIEENFGQGMFEALLKPYLMKNYPCTTELIRQTSNKHRRILDTLEPLFAQHRIIFDASVIREDYEGTNSLYPPEQALRYQLMYQISRLQKGANTLSQDDRIDALQMSCYYWILQLSKDQDMSMKTRKEELFSQELEQFFGHDNKDNTWFKI